MEYFKDAGMPTYARYISMGVDSKPTAYMHFIVSQYTGGRLHFLSIGHNVPCKAISDEGRDLNTVGGKKAIWWVQDVTYINQ
mmetsp:Transcript_10258/g.14500  ORF Transcript_10258/g.14500 Transcript_10258/m.14500 type:complete len:82 (-) Transcript_10258:277-522(-)